MRPASWLRRAEALTSRASGGEMVPGWVAIELLAEVKRLRKQARRGGNRK